MKEEEIRNSVVEKHLKTKIGCKCCIINFPIKKNEIDIIALDEREELFYIGECKRVERLTLMGQALGQLLSYITLIENYGLQFLETFKEGCRIPLPERMDRRIHSNERIPVKLFVAFDELGAQEYLNILNNLLEKVQYPIGCILIKKDGEACVKRKIHKCTIPYISRFNNETEFLEEVAKGISEILEERNLKQRIIPSRYLQILPSNINPQIHYEVSFREIQNQGEIEVGLHLEVGKILNQEVYKILKRMGKFNEIRSLLPNIIFQKTWDSEKEGGKPGRKRICLRDKKWSGKTFNLTYEVAERAIKSLSLLIKVFEPALRDIAQEVKELQKESDTLKAKIHFLKELAEKVKRSLPDKLRRKFGQRYPPAWFPSYRYPHLSFYFWKEEDIHFEFHFRPNRRIRVLLDLEHKELNDRLYDYILKNEEKIKNQLLSINFNLKPTVYPKNSKRLGEYLQWPEKKSYAEIKKELKEKMIKYVEVLAPLIKYFLTRCHRKLRINS